MIKKILQRFPLFILTIPLFIIIHLEQQYHNLINYQFVRYNIACLFIPPLIVFPLSYWIFRSIGKAGIYSCVLLLIFYFFSDLKDILHDAAPNNFLTSYSFLLPITALLLVTLFILLKKKQSTFTQTFAFLNISFILFIIVDLLSIVFNFSLINNDRGDQQKKISRSYTPISCDTCIKPDIYYILFDAYTSSEVLRSVFNYNNNIDSILQARNFYVIKHSRSNYNLTPFSISSCFNLQYLPGVDTMSKFYMNEYMPGVSTVYQNELIPILVKEGYDIVNHSIFSMTGYPPITPPFNIWYIDQLYSHHNIFKKIDNDIGWLIRKKIPLPFPKHNNVRRAEERDTHLAATIDALKKTIRTKKTAPQFVYAHFILPHAPYSLDSMGNKTNLIYRNLSEEEKKPAYINQVIYANKIMQDILKEIFTNAGRPLVIIIQGDHGFRSSYDHQKSLHFPNLNAMYFYNGDYRLLKDSMTNVNTFRIIFNTFFKQNFEMLKDTCYFLK